MYEKYIEQISISTLFSGISNEELIALLKCTKPKISHYNKNDYITIEGEEFESLGIIISGVATVCKENAAGNRMIISLVKTGDSFGEMVAFSDQTVWPATVIAQEKCEVMFLPIEKIISQCSNVCIWHKNLIQNLLKMISQRALQLSKKVEYLTIKSLRVKISKYLLEQYKSKSRNTFMIPMNRNDLADFFNVSRPSLSREISRMRDEGIIEFHKESFKLLDIDELKRIIEEN